MTSPTTSSAIAVGVDGSDGSNAALAWALEEAALRGATVRATYVWGYPVVAGPEGATFYLNPVELEADATKRLDEILTAQVPDAAVRGAIVRVVSEGSAANVLIEESHTADLVVVGARGHGGFVGLLVGSVSNQVVHHATGPVVVIHPPKHA